MPTAGRKYYHNKNTKQTTWDRPNPSPRPEGEGTQVDGGAGAADGPASAQAGAACTAGGRGGQDWGVEATPVARGRLGDAHEQDILGAALAPVNAVAVMALPATSATPLSGAVTPGTVTAAAAGKNFGGVRVVESAVACTAYDNHSLPLAAEARGVKVVTAGVAEYHKKIREMTEARGLPLDVKRHLQNAQALQRAAVMVASALQVLKQTRSARARTHTHTHTHSGKGRGRQLAITGVVTSR